MIGLLAALTAAVLALGWQLKLAWGDAAGARQQAQQAQQAVEEQQRQAQAVLGRLDSLDAALTKLAEGDQLAAQQLDQALAAIDGIAKTEDDSDEQMACLDVPVPRQLDDSLR